MSQKEKEVTITIAGEAGTGKSTLMSEVVALLQGLGLEVEEDWGLEGKPSGTNHDYKLRRVIQNTKVKVKTLQLRRSQKYDGLL